MKTMLLGMTVALATATTAAAADSYALDKSHSNIGFEISHMVISDVEGEFGDYVIHLELDTESLSASSVHAVIQTASVDTDNADRDEHLRNEDFFNVAKYPTMEFKSTKIMEKGGDWVAFGDFTMLGVTKQIELDFELSGPIQDPWGNTRVGIEASTTINRQDFGMSWSKVMDTGGLMVGNDVEIEIKFEAIRK
jgi:polyisoprenoid-binding protein YceI